MEFESPDVERDFPGLYASESGKKSNESDCTSSFFELFMHEIWCRYIECQYEYKFVKYDIHYVEFN